VGGMVARSLVFDRSVLYFVTRSGVVDSFTHPGDGCINNATEHVGC